jgi:hypothetical protein
MRKRDQTLLKLGYAADGVSVLRLFVASSISYLLLIIELNFTVE